LVLPVIHKTIKLGFRLDLVFFDDLLAAFGVPRNADVALLQAAAGVVVVVVVARHEL
jgi:hypothetical protein